MYGANRAGLGSEQRPRVATAPCGASGNMDSLSDRTYLTRELQSRADEFFRWIESARDIVIGTHVNPDGDALGSALALSHWLDRKGVPHEVLCAHAPPDNLRFLPGCERIRQAPQRREHDLAIVLDLESMRRLGAVRDWFEQAPRMALVDHHVPDEAPGDLRIVDSGAPATACILADMLVHRKATLSPEIATCLLTGIVTDTGSFRFQNTTAHAMHLAAQMVEAGANLAQVSAEVYQCKSLASVRLLAYTLEHMELACEGRLAWSVLPHEAYLQAEGTDEHTEGIVNEMLAIKSVEIAALIREHQPGRIRCSLRSRGKYDVAAAARQFNGGGHRAAAGISFDGSPRMAEDQIIEALKECLASC